MNDSVWLENEREIITNTIRRGDGMESFLHLTQVLEASDTNRNLNISSVLREIIESFITKRNSPDYYQIKQQLKWLRKFFVQHLLKLLRTASSETQRSYLIASNQLFILLKNTPPTEDYLTLVELWDGIVECYNERPNPSFLTSVTSTLSELYRLSISTSGIANVMLNVSFDSMISTTSSQERAAVVEFFRIVSRYNNAQYTNSVAIAMIIVEPVLSETKLAELCSLEYVKSFMIVMDNYKDFEIEVIVEKTQHVDVDGVVLFFRELLNEKNSVYSTKNYAAIFFVVSFIGLESLKATADALDLLADYLCVAKNLFVVKDQQIRLKNLISVALKCVEKLKNSSLSHAINDALIRLITAVVTITPQVYILLSKEGELTYFNALIHSNLQSNQRKKEEISFLSSLLRSGITPEEKLWINSHIEELYGDYSTILELFINETSQPNGKNIQISLLALARCIEHFRTCDFSKIPLLQQALNALIQITLPSSGRVKISFLHALCEINWKELKKLQVVNLSPQFPLKSLLTRLFQTLLTDPDESVRTVAHNSFPLVILQCYSSPREVIQRVLTRTALDANPTFRLAALQTFSSVVSKISSNSSLFYLSRSENPLASSATQILRIVHDVALSLLATSSSMYGRASNLAITTGFSAFCSVVQNVSRTPGPITRSPIFLEVFKTLQRLLIIITSAAGAPLTSAPLHVRKRHFEILDDPLWGGLAKHLIDLSARSNGLDDPLTMLADAVLRGLAPLIRALSIHETLIVTFICSYLRALRDDAPMAVLFCLQELLETQISIKSLNYKGFNEVSNLFKDFDMWVVPGIKIELVGSGKAWSELCHTCFFLLEDLIDNNSLEYPHSCAVMRICYIFTTIGKSIGIPNAADGWRGVTKEIDFDVLYNRLNSTMIESAEHLENIQTLYSIPFPSYALIPPLSLSLEPLQIINHCKALKEWIVVHPFLPQFHSQTLLYITSICLSLHEQLLNSSPTTAINTATNTLGVKMVSSYLQTHEGNHISAQIGYLKLYHAIESDQTLVNKKHVLRDLALHIRLLTAFHIVFDLLDSLLEISFTNGKFIEFSAQLFVHCALPMYWGIRSLRELHIFFLKPSKTINLTNIFLHQAQLSVNFPSTLKVIAFRTLFESIYLCPSGSVNRSNAFTTLNELQTSSIMDFSPLLTLMSEAQWAVSKQTKISFQCTSINDLSKLSHYLPSAPYDLFLHHFVNNFLFYASQKKIYDMILPLFDDLPERDFILLYDYFSSQLLCPIKTSHHNNSTFDSLYDDFNQLTHYLPYLRNASFEKGIVPLFTLLYNRINLVHFSRTLFLSISNIQYHSLCIHVATFLQKHIHYLPIYTNSNDDNTQYSLINISDTTELLSTNFWQYTTPPVNSQKMALSAIITLSRSLTLPLNNTEQLCIFALDELVRTNDIFYIQMIHSLISLYDNIITIGLEQPRRLLTWGQVSSYMHWSILTPLITNKCLSIFFKRKTVSTNDINQQSTQTPSKKNSKTNTNSLGHTNPFELTTLSLLLLTDSSKQLPFLRFLVLLQPTLQLEVQQLLKEQYENLKHLQSSVQFLAAYNSISLDLIFHISPILSKDSPLTHHMAFFLALNHNIPSFLDYSTKYISYIKTSLHVIFGCEPTSLIITLKIVPSPYKLSWRIALTFLLSLIEALTIEDVGIINSILGKNMLSTDPLSFKTSRGKLSTFFRNKLSFVPQFDL
ncbi:Dopey N-terminal domain-containing protein [Entamoeba marina]